MAETRKKIRVAAVADLHVKEDGAKSYKELFAEVSGVADVLVMAGDLTDLGKPKEAELLAADLRSCTVPVVAVLGNHDHESGSVEEVTQISDQHVAILYRRQATAFCAPIVGGFAYDHDS